MHTKPQTHSRARPALATHRSGRHHCPHQSAPRPNRCKTCTGRTPGQVTVQKLQGLLRNRDTALGRLLTRQEVLAFRPRTRQVYTACCKRFWKPEQCSLAEMQLNRPGFPGICPVSAMSRDQEDHTNFTTRQSSNPKGCSSAPPRNVFTSLRELSSGSQSLQASPSCAEANVVFFPPFRF